MRLLHRILCLLVFVPAAAPRAADVARPNILFIAVDDLRPELGAYGHKTVKSPRIDRLAQQSLTFQRAYCQFALCNPSRASLLSGRRPESLRVFTLASFLRDRNPDVITLPEHFKNHGYQTRSIGKIFHYGNGNHDDPASWSAPPWHHAGDDQGPRPQRKPAGLSGDPDSVDHAGDLPAEMPDVSDDALIDGQIAGRAIWTLGELKDQPFFLAVGFIRPHLPFIAPKRYWDLYDPAALPVPASAAPPLGAPSFASNEASELRRYKGIPATGPAVDAAGARHLIHGYHACISYVDAQIGRVLDELERLGLRERTLIVVWGDHGYQLGEHGTWNKRTNWEWATRVPLLVSAPGSKARGRTTGALVELVDLFPTLTSFCGLPEPPGLEGTSFVPLLDDPEQPWKKAAFSFYTKKVPGLRNTTVRGRAIRTAQYRFISWTGPALPEPVCELYDHQTDPGENTNIARQPENAGLAARLAAQLEAGWKAARP